ncbi:cytokine receptor-like isoform X1 [Zophobas morio]|uniref:cytokine receptor-like isoform X1 n=1 Tax=Zophobas morio TaxID=2755281 RepID=UPI0030828DBA
MQILFAFFCISIYFAVACQIGYISPKGHDIEIEYGNPLNLACVITDTTYKSDSLSFTRNDEPIPSEMIDVVNSTVINLHIPKPALVSKDLYTCISNDTTVCKTYVSVGIKPQKVTDFSCISNNYDNLTCSWTTPNNYVSTDYNLTFTVGEGRAARYIYLCPVLQSEANNKRKYCFWDKLTTPHYRLVYESFNFTLKMNNTFGQNQINVYFVHFSKVWSGPPENLMAESVTPSSVYLSWRVPSSMQTFPPGVHHRILYQCKYGKKEWKLGGMLTGRSFRGRTSFNLTNLPNAHTICEIRVSLRSAKALPDDKSMWSRNASITVRTGSKIPDEPPLTDVGSFEIVAFDDGYREVYIYWKHIKEKQKNGPLFRYGISCEEDDSIKPTEITNAYAKFDNLPASKSYTFHIWSENMNGSSLGRSTVRVPEEADHVKEPKNFIAVKFSEGDFELFWEPPELSTNQYITNYTIFTCSNVRDRPDQCTGLLNWKVVSNKTTAVDMKVNKNQIFQLAIAANTKDSSSGMLWSDCKIKYYKNKRGKLRNVWIYRVGVTFVELGWARDCKDGIVNVYGYIAYYCPIKGPLHAECTAPATNITFPGNAISRGNITDLSPHTTYMFTISAVTKRNTFSQQSDPLYSTTLAG